jgi:hypothetical protein
VNQPVTLTPEQFSSLINKAAVPAPDYTPATACARLGLSRSQFWREIHAAGVPQIKWQGKCIRFAFEVIEELRRKRMVQTIADQARRVDGRRRG